MKDSELYQRSMQFLDEHPEMLNLEYRLITEKLLEMNHDLKELLIPTRLEMLTYDHFKDSRYVLACLPRGACENLGIETRFRYDQHDCIVRAEDFDEIYEMSLNFLVLQMMEPIKGVKVNRRKYNKSSTVNKSRKVTIKKVGKLEDFLENQVIDFVESHDKEFFTNHLIKDVRQRFLEFSIEKVGNSAYLHRNQKNPRLTEIVNERYGLIPVKFRIETKDEYDTFKGDNRKIGGYADFFMEDM